jgi:hypothetical protein
MEDKIVLICATGRSGSTTMQRIINTIPNSNICGENFSAIISLLDFYIKLHNSSIQYIHGHYKPESYDNLIKQNIKPAWYNSYNILEIEQHIRQTIISMFKNNNNTILWGFKEIRYDNKRINYIKYFKQLFPQTKLIIQIRENIVFQSNSGWHKNNPKAYTYLKQLNSEFLHFYNQNKDWCYFTTFEKMFDLNNIKNIFKFIDCTEQYNETKVIEIISNNIKD